MSRKQRSTRAPRATKSVKPRVKTVKVKVKVEPPDEVTCSTDDVRRQSTPASDVNARCDSHSAAAAGDGLLLPDTTTTDSAGDVIVDVVTSFSGRCPSVSGDGVVGEEMATASSHGSAAQPVPVGLHRPLATSSIISPYQHQYHYAGVHYAAPLQQQYYQRYDDTTPSNVAAAVGVRDGPPRFVDDDIDDILSVMARVAGSPPHAFTY